MFCSFTKSPRIMRFFCKGSVVEWDDGRFEGLMSKMGKKQVEGARAVILLDVLKVSFSIVDSSSSKNALFMWCRCKHHAVSVFRF